MNRFFDRLRHSLPHRIKSIIEDLLSFRHRLRRRGIIGESHFFRIGEGVNTKYASGTGFKTDRQNSRRQKTHTRCQNIQHSQTKHHRTGRQAQPQPLMVFKEVDDFAENGIFCPYTC